MPTDLWLMLLVATLLAGVLGFISTPINSCVVWFCEWREGNPIDWGMNIGSVLYLPFAFFFAIFEIYMLYIKP